RPRRDQLDGPVKGGVPRVELDDRADHPRVPTDEPRGHDGRGGRGPRCLGESRLPDLLVIPGTVPALRQRARPADVGAVPAVAVAWSPSSRQVISRSHAAAVSNSSRQDGCGAATATATAMNSG